MDSTAEYRVYYHCTRLRAMFPKQDMAVPQSGAFTYEDAMKEISLTHGRVAIVDDEDYELVSAYKWWASACGRRGSHVYALARKGSHYVRMHRVIMSPFLNQVVDHIDGNGLNNTRSNLRVCIQAENNRNRREFRGASALKGVWYDKGRRKWRAGIWHQGRNIHLGMYVDESAAGHAYDVAARLFYGVFACTNYEIKELT